MPLPPLCEARARTGGRAERVLEFLGLPVWQAAVHPVRPTARRRLCHRHARPGRRGVAGYDRLCRIRRTRRHAGAAVALAGSIEESIAKKIENFVERGAVVESKKEMLLW